MTTPAVEIPSLRAYLGAIACTRTTSQTVTLGLYKLQGGLTQNDIDVRAVVNAAIDALDTLAADAFDGEIANGNLFTAADYFRFYAASSGPGNGDLLATIGNGEIDFWANNITTTGNVDAGEVYANYVEIVGDIQAGAKLLATGSFGVFGSSGPGAKPAVTGSRGGNAALASLLTALASFGLITDSTTA
jgi:hypothetical protein